MAENKHTLSDLYQMQSLPLSAKIRMTCYRIRQWVEEYGTDGVYVSFSGGKDSTVLLDIVRNECGFKDIPAVFVDVPTQYPELRDFAKTFDNVEIIRPKVSFMEVCEKYGFPLISKEVSGAVDNAKKYLDKIAEIKSTSYRQTDRQTDRQIIYADHFADLIGIPRRGTEKQNETYLNLKRGIIPDELYEFAKSEGLFIPERLLMLHGEVIHKEKGKITDEYSQRYDKSKYRFFLSAQFTLSDKCCNKMKKEPIHKYAKETGRLPITAQMAEESLLRTQKWIKNGCNGFNMKSPISNPMSFWTEQDVLQYIYERKLPICSVYGDVVEDFNKEDKIEGQISLWESDKPILKTTGCKRTGCMLCGFGCHMKDDNRFLQLKETHPKMYGLLDVCKNNGVTFREAIEWTNEHGNLNIKL